MPYFQTPQVNFVDAKDIYSGPTHMFLASMQQAVEERQKQQDAELRRQAEGEKVRQFNEMMTERQRDNVRDQQRINNEAQQARDRLKQERDLEEAKRTEATAKENRAAGLAIHKSIAAGNPDEAAAIAAMHPGIRIVAPVPQPQRVSLSEGEPTPETPNETNAPLIRYADVKQRLAGGAPTPVQPPPFTPGTPSATPTEMPSAPASPAAGPSPVAVAQQRYRVEVPGLSPFMVSQFEAADAANAKLAHDIELATPHLAELEKSVKTPFQRQAFEDISGGVRGGQLTPAKNAIFTAYEKRVKELEAEAGKNARNVRSASASRATHADTSGSRANTALRGDVKDFEAKENVAKLNSSTAALKRALHEMEADSKVGKFGAYESFLTGLRQGVPTNLVMEQAESHTGGVWDRFKNSLARARSGDYGAEVQDDIRKGIRAAIQAADDQRRDSALRFDEQFGSPLYDEMRGDVEAVRGRLFGHRKGEEGPKGPMRAITPSGRRVTVQPSAGAPVKSAADYVREHSQ